MRWFAVIVCFAEFGDRPFIDGIHASCRESALRFARWNWEGATVSVMAR